MIFFTGEKGKDVGVVSKVRNMVSNKSSNGTAPITSISQSRKVAANKGGTTATPKKQQVSQKYKLS